MTSNTGRSRNNFVWPSEFDELLYRGGLKTPQAAILLGRTRRTIGDWRAGNRPVPRWAFRLVQLTLLERYEAWGVHCLTLESTTDSIDAESGVTTPYSNRINALQRETADSDDRVTCYVKDKPITGSRFRPWSATRPCPDRPRNGSILPHQCPNYTGQKRRSPLGRGAAERHCSTHSQGACFRVRDSQGPPNGTDKARSRWIEPMTWREAT
jgi:hypothetical protein